MSGWGGTQQSLISSGLVPVPVLYTIFQVCRPLREYPLPPGFVWTEAITYAFANVSGGGRFLNE